MNFLVAAAPTADAPCLGMYQPCTATVYIPTYTNYLHSTDDVFLSHVLQGFPLPPR